MPFGFIEDGADLGKVPDTSIVINENSGIPIWRQLRSRLIYLITSGSYEGGSQLPTVREMAVDLGINYNTVSKVYKDIERDGYITTKRGIGTFVVSDLATNQDDNSQGYKDLVREFVQQCDELGIPKNEIVGLVQDYLEN
ncbi:MAG: GntR family transcriptional regulator [Coriobacteriia bacterium]|nr:GntR family transcriptional regulator [Coriobacteriia bacterium]